MYINDMCISKNNAEVCKMLQLQRYFGFKRLLHVQSFATFDVTNTKI